MDGRSLDQCGLVVRIVEGRVYTELPGLADVYLEDSYVLGIEARPAELRFLLDLVLTPSHEQYRPPLPGEQHCYRKGLADLQGSNSAPVDRSRCTSGP